MRKTRPQLHAHRHAGARQAQHERKRWRERLRVKQSLRLRLLRAAQLAAGRVQPQDGGGGACTIGEEGRTRAAGGGVGGNVARVHACPRAERQVCRGERGGQRIELHRHGGTAGRGVDGGIRADAAPQVGHEARNPREAAGAVMRNYRAGGLLCGLLREHERAGALAELGACTGASLREGDDGGGLLGAKSVRTQGSNGPEGIGIQRIEFVGRRERAVAEG